MGYTEGKWRLKAIIFIFVMTTILYTTQFYFALAEHEIALNDPSLSITNETDISDVRNTTVDTSIDIFDFFGAIWATYSFQLLDGTPTWASALLTLFTSCLLIAGVYIAYTFVHETIKALPFT